MAEIKVVVIETPLGKMRAQVVNAERVVFTTTADGVVDTFPPFVINGVPHRVTVTVDVKEDGKVLIENARQRGAYASLEDGHLGVNACRTDVYARKRRGFGLRRCTGSLAAHKKIARMILAHLVKLAQGFKAERGAVGAQVLLDAAKSHERNAEINMQTAKEYQAKAQAMREQAQVLLDRHAWACEPVADAPGA